MSDQIILACFKLGRSFMDLRNHSLPHLPLILLTANSKRPIKITETSLQSFPKYSKQLKRFKQGK